MWNSPDPESIDLLELSDRSKVSPRTIRYYIQQGLLPAPEARGPGAHYGGEHLDRLRLIRRLQQEHLPLSEIRRRIEKLSPEELRQILETPPEPEPPSASEYVRRVLSEGAATVKAAAPLLSARPAPPTRSYPGAATSGMHRPAQSSRSQWERFNLAPDVELHVRRPGSREDQRKIERILEAAREIFREDLP
ncbi:MAG TPA: MerR family transcriptional regulator [Gemmatimonadaceae bacterium]|nr:MerR family transcriptional regulator [Gemmatimonadaceae bacterium]